MTTPSAPSSAGGAAGVAPPARRLLVVVGYDGCAAALRAVDAARRLISGRTGSVEVAYVAHPPIGADLSPQARAELIRGFDAAEAQFRREIDSRFSGVEQRWRFHRRSGQVAHELIALSDELMHEFGSDADLVIVVGSAARAYHHVVGSVPVALVRRARYPIVVVP